MVVVSAGHEGVGGTRGESTVSSAAAVPGIISLHRMRDAGGVCEMCLCLPRVGIGGKG